MAETASLEPIGRTVIKAMEAVRKLAGVPEAIIRQLQDDQPVMIRMLESREAEIDLMRSQEQRYAGLRARMGEFEERLVKLEVAR